MYQDDPLEPEGGYAPSHYQGKDPIKVESTREYDLDSASCPEEDTKFEFVECNQEGPPLRAIDSDKIQTLDDVKLIINALQIQCTQDIVEKFGLEFLMKD